eukprot:418373-Pyramimonas_sp.AAC.1
MAKDELAGRRKAARAAFKGLDALEKERWAQDARSASSSTAPLPPALEPREFACANFRDDLLWGIGDEDIPLTS